jgi:uncharacterized membrane protein
MIILVILIVTTLLARILGLSGVTVLDPWAAATRVGLCAMFLVAALAHFNSMRHDLARMVPPVVRHPLAVIYFTGGCEVLGAIGLLLPWTRIYSAAGLSLFLLAVLPANIHAANAEVTLRGKPAMPLIARIPMQVLFIVLTLWAGIIHAK